MPVKKAVQGDDRGCRTGRRRRPGRTPALSARRVRDPVRTEPGVSRPDGELARGADGFFHGDRRAAVPAGRPGRGRAAGPGRAAACAAADRRGFRAVAARPGRAHRGPRGHPAPGAPGRPGRAAGGAATSSTPAGARSPCGSSVAAGTDLAPMDRVKAGRPRPARPRAPTTAGSPGARTASPCGCARRRRPRSATPARPAALRHRAGAGRRWAGPACTAEDARTSDRCPTATPGARRAPVRRPARAPRRGATWRCAAPTGGSTACWRGRSPTWTGCCCRPADARRTTTCSSPPARPGTSPCSAATRCGRRGCCCRWAPSWPPARCARWPAGRAPASTRTPRSSRARSCTRCGASPVDTARAASRCRRCYYGTVDATPLWIILLHDAWRWGLTRRRSRPCCRTRKRALAWMARPRRRRRRRAAGVRRPHRPGPGQPGLEGLRRLHPLRATAGWPSRPIALCEVQAYAYEAARGGAALLRGASAGRARTAGRSGRTGCGRRFRETFWVEDAHGPLPGGRAGRATSGRSTRSPPASATCSAPVCSTAEESALVAARLAGADLDCGLRAAHAVQRRRRGSTRSATTSVPCGRTTPRSRCTGWPAPGSRTRRPSLAAGLVAAAAAFDGRLPELFAGHGSAADARPAPYPASCRPQAWSAAAPVLAAHRARSAWRRRARRHARGRTRPGAAPTGR